MSNARLSALRILGSICPRAFGLDFRIIGRLHGLASNAMHDVVCGNGFLMSADTRNAAYVAGVSERAYMEALAKLIRPRQLIYDVGANTGYLALWLATRFRERGGVHVVGFEPDPRTAELMKANVALNPGLKVAVETLALGDMDGTETLHSSGAGDGAASILSRAPHQTVSGIVVHVAKLDTYQRANDQRPDWLILDVEGYGGHVIRGSELTIRSCLPYVAAEIHSAEECHAIESALSILGYVRTHALRNIWGTHVIWRSIHRGRLASLMSGQ